MWATWASAMRTANGSVGNHWQQQPLLPPGAPGSRLLPAVERRATCDAAGVGGAAEVTSSMRTLLGGCIGPMPCRMACNHCFYCSFHLVACQSWCPADVCADLVPAECPGWAATGECQANPGYMVGVMAQPGNCMVSCKVCKPGERNTLSAVCLHPFVGSPGQRRQLQNDITVLRAAQHCVISRAEFSNICF